MSDRDPLLVRLGPRWPRLDAQAHGTDPRSQSKPAAGTQGDLQGCCDDGHSADAQPPATQRLPADDRRGHQTQPGQAHLGPTHRCSHLGDVETSGGLRPEQTDTRSAVAVTQVEQRRCLSRACPCTASCHSFEGKHPCPTWPLQREEQALSLDYAPSEHRLKPWPTRPHQENGALLFRDIDVDFNSPLASAPLVTDCILPLSAKTEDLNRAVRHGAPQRPGETANRPPDVGTASEKDSCALDISPSRRRALERTPKASS